MRRECDVSTYELRMADPGQAESFQPGQFSMLYVPGIGEAAISISGKTKDGLLQHTVRTVGRSPLRWNAVGSGFRWAFAVPLGRLGRLTDCAGRHRVHRPIVRM